MSIARKIKKKDLIIFIFVIYIFLNNKNSIFFSNKRDQVFFGQNKLRPYASTLNSETIP